MSTMKFFPKEEKLLWSVFFEGLSPWRVTMIISLRAIVRETEVATVLQRPLQ